MPATKNKQTTRHNIPNLKSDRLLEPELIRPAMKFTLHVIAAALATAVVLFAVALWRLSAGPISLAFLAPYLEEALSVL